MSEVNTNLLTLLFLVVYLVSVGSLDISPWSYTCDEVKRCVKVGIALEEEAPLGLFECKLRCEEYGLFWPRPRDLSIKDVAPNNRSIAITHPTKIIFANKDTFMPSTPNLGSWLEENIQEQTEWLWKNYPLNNTNLEPTDDDLELRINIQINEMNDQPQIRKSTNESYSLSVVTLNSDAITANISADTYFGARHGMETFFQAIEYDDVRNAFVTLSDFEIDDHPEFSHRGLLLDTSRNFVSKNTIINILDGLAASKHNVLHWHIADSQSFPLEMKADTLKQMTLYGAYDPQSVYLQDDVKDVVAHANKRGIRVIPELDQPAHVGNGWNYPGAEDYVICFNHEPWYEKCVEPPCGQLNPGSAEMYDRLLEIYGEFYDMFQYDTFHMGGDEVNFNCWNTSEIVLDYMATKGYDRSEEGFIDLWDEFNRKSREKLQQVGNIDDLDIIISTSTITGSNYIDRLENGSYTIQIWTEGQDTNDQQIKILVEKGYRMIFSNFDNTYLDCGFGAWVGEGNNWCSPYKGWQKMYSNNPYELIEMRGINLTTSVKSLVLGGESALWTEQADDQTIESKIFPRAAAYAEQLWANPKSRWYDAEQRMLNHRLKLVQRGIRADKIQPQWCMVNGGQCYLIRDNPHRPIV